MVYAYKQKLSDQKNYLENELRTNLTQILHCEKTAHYIQIKSFISI